MEVVLSENTSAAAALKIAKQQLADVERPALEAEVLLAHVLSLTRSRLLSLSVAPGVLPPATLVHPCTSEQKLSETQLMQFNRLIQRRAAGEPVAYLTGHREFWSLDLQVTPDVLIPRPETELLVELALERIPVDAAWRIADLGAGSGAIALAIARERPRCQIIATDISEAALEIARANAERLNIRNIEFRLGDWFSPLQGEYFDMIVSNPPYIKTDDPHLNDLRFEPPLALVAGADGLQHLRTIAGAARKYLAFPSLTRLRHPLPQAEGRGEGGWLLMEHGYDQAPELLRILTDLGYRHVDDYADLAGIPRIIVAEWKSHE